MIDYILIGATVSMFESRGSVTELALAVESENAPAYQLYRGGDEYIQISTHSCSPSVVSSIQPYYSILRLRTIHSRPPNIIWELNLSSRHELIQYALQKDLMHGT
jgi:hypothetical protein